MMTLNIQKKFPSSPVRQEKINEINNSKGSDQVLTRLKFLDFNLQFFSSESSKKVN